MDSLAQTLLRKVLPVARHYFTGLSSDRAGGKGNLISIASLPGLDNHQRMSGNRDEFIPTRRSLITRLKNWDDQQSWQEFFDTYWRLIYSVALKAGLSPSDSQDIVQETVVSVARQMPGFHYDPSAGSFKSWLMVITRRRIIDHLRKRARTPQAYSEHR